MNHLTKYEEISTGYCPRPFQQKIHRRLKRFNVLVCHRRFGKTVMAINELIDQALRCTLKNPQYCYDSPETCDLCGKSFLGAEFLVDGETKGTEQIQVPGGDSMGQWAYMCANCFASHGVAVGWGRGQLYQRRDDGSWLMVAGFPPDE